MRKVRRVAIPVILVAIGFLLLRGMGIRSAAKQREADCQSWLQNAEKHVFTGPWETVDLSTQRARAVCPSSSATDLRLEVLEAHIAAQRRAGALSPRP